MKKQESGFTLVELVVVIVILGILAAVAMPRFINLRPEAQAAAIQGVRGGIESASAINFGARSANATRGVATVGLTCQGAVAALLQGGIPNGYTFDNTTVLVAGDNACAVNLTGFTPETPVTANIVGII